MWRVEWTATTSYHQNARIGKLARPAIVSHSPSLDTTEVEGQHLAAGTHPAALRAAAVSGAPAAGTGAATPSAVAGRTFAAAAAAATVLVAAGAAAGAVQRSALLLETLQPFHALT